MRRDILLVLLIYLSSMTDQRGENIGGVLPKKKRKDKWKWETPSRHSRRQLVVTIFEIRFVYFVVGSRRSCLDWCSWATIFFASWCSFWSLDGGLPSYCCCCCCFVVDRESFFLLCCLTVTVSRSASSSVQINGIGRDRHQLLSKTCVFLSNDSLFFSKLPVVLRSTSKYDRSNSNEKNGTRVWVLF